MKERFFKWKESGFAVMLILLFCGLFGIADAGAMTADAVLLPDGGAVDVNSAVTATETRDNSERLILDHLDKTVTKIRPHDVVLDTIARHVTDIRNVDMQIVRHYAIDVIPLTANVAAAVSPSASQVELFTDNRDIFASEQTIAVMGVSGYLPDGSTPNPQGQLVLYAVNRSVAGNPIVVAVNGTGSNRQGLPAIPVNTKLVRLGRAGSERQIATSPYAGVPTDFELYLQKFMSQVEMSTIFERAEKEVNWTFNDAEQESIFDMKRLINASMYLGDKSRLRIANQHAQTPEDTYFTGNIWEQAGKAYDFGGIAPDRKSIVNFMKEGFTGNSSSKKKLLLCGCDLLEALESVDYNNVVMVGSQSQIYGVEFSSVISFFGKAMAVHDNTLDDIGWGDRGLLLDPDFLVKYTMGWKTQNFDLRKSAQSDADGRMIMEICGFGLKNPKAHMTVTL